MTDKAPCQRCRQVRWFGLLMAIMMLIGYALLTTEGG